MSRAPVCDARRHDRLYERLSHLSTILPVFAQELASARREAARLRVENARLAEELRRTQVARDAPVSEARFGAGQLLAAGGPALDGDRCGDRGTALGA